MTSEKIALPLETTFNALSQPQKRGRKPFGKASQPSPFCIRLSAEERAWLEDQAGSRPLGAYIRARLLGDRSQKRRESRRPRADEQAIAQLLAGLKSSRLSPNVNQLAKAANCGNLDVSREVEEQLEDACKAILAMRAALFIALGLKPEGTDGGEAP